MKGWLISLCAALAFGGQFSSDVEMVPLHVSVLDSQQRFIDGLEAQDFSVLDNGRPQDVSFFGASAMPLDVALLFDSSGSMGAPLPLIKKAATGFIDHLRPEDRAAILGFDRHLRLQEELTGDHRSLRAAIARFTTSGPTAFFDAIYITTHQLKTDRERSGVIRRQAIVIFSDGVDTASHLSLDDALAAVRQSGATVYTIAPQPFETGSPLHDGTKERRESAYALRTLARDSGGRAFVIADVTMLPDVYATVAAELRHQYTLAFKPAPRGNSLLRQLEVRLRAHPGAVVRTRLSYAPPQ